MRILILGNAGSGKSTLARSLGQATGIDVIHLDARYWHAGWEPTPREKWKQTVEALAKRSSWIMDGNYPSTLDIRIKRAETIIYLDCPRRICYWRIMKRLLKYRISDRPDMAPGCPEKIDWEFILWIWNFPKKIKPQLFTHIQAADPSIPFYHLSTKAEISQIKNKLAVLSQ
ncbi:MAG: AAA family ATPase [FCB group bacterium]|nr:AAA family ATPase [FCB group bacterium]